MTLLDTFVQTISNRRWSYFEEDSFEEKIDNLLVEKSFVTDLENKKATFKIFLKEDPSFLVATCTLYQTKPTQSGYVGWDYPDYEITDQGYLWLLDLFYEKWKSYVSKEKSS